MQSRRSHTSEPSTVRVAKAFDFMASTPQILLVTMVARRKRIETATREKKATTITPLTNTSLASVVPLMYIADDVLA